MSKDNVFIALCPPENFIPVFKTILSKFNLNCSVYCGLDTWLNDYKKIFPDIRKYSLESWISGDNVSEFSDIPDVAIDLEELEYLSAFEHEILKNFDRYDYLDTINYQDRYDIYLNIIKFWKKLILYFKPKIFFISFFPHRVDDQVLYYLCKYYSVKTVIFDSLFLHYTRYLRIRSSMDDQYIMIPNNKCHSKMFDSKLDLFFEDERFLITPFYEQAAQNRSFQKRKKDFKYYIKKSLDFMEKRVPFIRIIHPDLSVFQIPIQKVGFKYYYGKNCQFSIFTKLKYRFQSYTKRQFLKKAYNR
jgi:hypothetical protein